MKPEVREKLKDYILADTVPSIVESTFIDLLVGNDYYADILSNQRRTLTDGLYLLQSKLAWIPSGRTNELIPPSKDYSMLMLTSSSSKIATKVMSFVEPDDYMEGKPRNEGFWKLEAIRVNDVINKKDVINERNIINEKDVINKKRRHLRKERHRQRSHQRNRRHQHNRGHQRNRSHQRK